ncbi:MAG: hypothetical protein K2J84_10515 [Bacteroidaceae bacterium]|nr:hypothetical protein [Bacteroidaceae bacterium]
MAKFILTAKQNICLGSSTAFIKQGSQEIINISVNNVTASTLFTTKANCALLAKTLNREFGTDFFNEKNVLGYTSFSVKPLLDG